MIDLEIWIKRLIKKNSMKIVVYLFYRFIEALFLIS